MTGVAAAAAVVSAGAGIAGQVMGGNAQSSAANDANATQQAQYQQMRADLLPYMQTGASANSSLQNLTGVGTGNELTSPLLKPIQMDQATLEKTPGYQFNLQQGLRAVQNTASARGLGISGAAQKGAAQYATGLADTTYQNQFNNAALNQSNAYNRLLGLAQLGQTSAAGVGSAGIQTGQGIASNTIGAGTAQAASGVGAANTLGSAYGNYAGNQLLSKLGSSNGLYSNQDVSNAVADSIKANPSIF